MDVYKAKIQSDGSLKNLILRIVVRGDMQNKDLIGYTWSPTYSMSNLKYFLGDSFKHKARVYQLGFIGLFLQGKVENMVLRSWKVDMQTILQNVQFTLEDPLYY